MEQITNKFATELRKWWSFNSGQVHTHSWHSREDFIEKKLPELLSAVNNEKVATEIGKALLLSASLPPSWRLRIETDEGDIAVYLYEGRKGHDYGYVEERGLAAQIMAAIEYAKEHQ